MSPEPSGQVRPPRQIAFTRTFTAPIDDVWASVTESSRLARWYGSWSGDPVSGVIEITMTGEAGQPSEPARIVRCDPPRLLTITFTGTQEEWLLDLELAEEAGQTTLVLVQTFISADSVSDVGPGWEYYLDRLVAARTGDDPEEISFERDYHPSMVDYYRALARDLRFDVAD